MKVLPIWKKITATNNNTNSVATKIKFFHTYQAFICQQKQTMTNGLMLDVDKGPTNPKKKTRTVRYNNTNSVATKTKLFPHKPSIYLPTKTDNGKRIVARCRWKSYQSEKKYKKRKNMLKNS